MDDVIIETTQVKSSCFCCWLIAFTVFEKQKIIKKIDLIMDTIHFRVG